MKQTARSKRGGLTAAEVMALHEYRLEADLTYRELAIHMGLALSKVHQLLNDPTVVANERTVFKVRRFLRHRETPAPWKPVSTRERTVS